MILRLFNSLLIYESMPGFEPLSCQYSFDIFTCLKPKVLELHSVGVVIAVSWTFCTATNCGALPRHPVFVEGLSLACGSRTTLPTSYVAHAFANASTVLCSLIPLYSCDPEIAQELALLTHTTRLALPLR